MKTEKAFIPSVCVREVMVTPPPKQQMLAVNGMSYHSRAGQNANSAMVVTEGPEDFGSDAILAGMEFQRKLERAAYEAGEGKIPVQLVIS